MLCDCLPCTFVVYMLSLYFTAFLHLLCEHGWHANDVPGMSAITWDSPVPFEAVVAVAPFIMFHISIMFPILPGLGVTVTAPEPPVFMDTV